MGSQPLSSGPRYVDIGINLADPIFRGIYHGTRRHPDDLAAVVQRASDVGCKKLIVTGSDIQNSRDALNIAREFPGSVFTTAGIHPCSSSVFAAPRSPEPEETGQAVGSSPGLGSAAPDEVRTAAVMTELEALFLRAGLPDSALVAFGEFGLDYDRLHYCSKELQLHSFARQLSLAAALPTQLPLFLHSRAAHQDFVRLLRNQYGSGLEGLKRGGVVHSFTGTLTEMEELTRLGLYIGVNGCSLKTADNCSVVKEIPLGRIMLETDGPWCEIRPSHEGWKYLAASEAAATGPAGEQEATPEKGEKRQGAKKVKAPAGGVMGRYRAVKKEKWTEGSMVKGRNEPCMIEHVATIVAGIKSLDVREVREAAWQNTVELFGLQGGYSTEETLGVRQMHLRRCI